jgi:hypothetical protein
MSRARTLVKLGGIRSLADDHKDFNSNARAFRRLASIRFTLPMLRKQFWVDARSKVRIEAPSAPGSHIVTLGLDIRHAQGLD